MYIYSVCVTYFSSIDSVVGQSAAEFTLAMMHHPTSHGLEAAAAAEPAGALAAEMPQIPAGVYTPEELARDGRVRIYIYIYICIYIYIYIYMYIYSVSGENVCSSRCHGKKRFLVVGGAS